MGMPEKIWAMKTGVGYGDYVVPKMGTERTEYIRADIATQLAEALEYYANERIYEKGHEFSEVESDYGTIARQALSRYHGEKT